MSARLLGRMSDAEFTAVYLELLRSTANLVKVGQQSLAASTLLREKGIPIERFLKELQPFLTEIDHNRFCELVRTLTDSDEEVTWQEGR